MTKQNIPYWVIPPECDAEFAAHMENVLETYEKPYDPAQPVVCMDEQPVQLIKETRKPIPATKDHGKRVDYEYERNARLRYSCSANLSEGGVRRPHESNAPGLTGHRKRRLCWMEDTLSVSG